MRRACYLTVNVIIPFFTLITQLGNERRSASSYIMHDVGQLKPNYNNSIPKIPVEVLDTSPFGAGELSSN